MPSNLGVSDQLCFDLTSAIRVQRATESVFMLCSRDEVIDKASTSLPDRLLLGALRLTLRCILPARDLQLLHPTSVSAGKLRTENISSRLSAGPRPSLFMRPPRRLEDVGLCHRACCAHDRSEPCARRSDRERSHRSGKLIIFCRSASAIFIFATPRLDTVNKAIRDLHCNDLVLITSSFCRSETTFRLYQ